MLILDELYNIVVFEVSSDELIRILKEIKNKKEIDIDLLKYKIHMFEKKKRIDHRAVQSGYLEVSSPASYSLTTGN